MKCLSRGSQFLELAKHQQARRLNARVAVLLQPLVVRLEEAYWGGRQQFAASAFLVRGLDRSLSL
jgi:hypothetical protein